VLGLTIGLGLAVGVPLGYVLQRGGFCMNTAFRSILFERDRSVLRSYVLVLLINIVAVNLLDDLHIITLVRSPLNWLAMSVGGLVFGAGMVLAGGCASGSCYRAASGMVGSLVAYLGFALGATAIQVGALLPLLRTLREPELDVLGVEPTLYNVISPDSPAVKWAVIAALAVTATVWLLRAPRQKFRTGWPWWATGLALGALAVAAWLVSRLTERDYGLSFVQPTVSLVRLTLFADAGGINIATYMLLGVPVGAVLAARRAGELSLRAPSPARLVQQLAGGITMGVGAGLAGGCNIGQGITGVSTLALGSILATLATMAGVWSATAILYASVSRAGGRVAAQTKT
jgi:hypothetical protein